jgi:3-hydroxyisobutyrate dehydrogenase
MRPSRCARAARALRVRARLTAGWQGGVGGAEAGTLTFMVGGEAAAFNRALPVLKCMGKNIVHCGAIGTGQVAKICNNLVLGISMTAVSEAMNLGKRLGACVRACRRPCQAHRARTTLQALT